MIPEEGQVRKLKHVSGKTQLIRIERVYPANEGPKAWWVMDSKGNHWLFSMPPGKVQ